MEFLVWGKRLSFSIQLQHLASAFPHPYISAYKKYMVTLPPEKLGSFYLGAEYDIDSKQVTDFAINYDSRDLTTHAVCVGMTGSGKTGLCIGLLEEAAIDKVPAIIIDPKGDMTNLLLQFEDLKPEDFEEWINADDAGRKGMTVSQYASSTAEKWKKGLASWGQDKSRIKLLKESVDYTIYTPGSDSGVPVNIMGSFAAPSVNFDDDAEMLHERIQGTVAALLGMIENDADPVRSREGILLSSIFEHHWRKNEDLDLAILIQDIQNPPVKKMGVFDVDTFFPEKDRFQLAMDFNTLMASPQFRYWLQGEDLDIEKMYFTADGKPRHSIFYIAHLSESERMFFVTLLLNSLITWMRSQSGTTSLRSLLYFDEIFGYFPPTAEPPSKKPLLTMLKQARAYGVGTVLVTQNPVDIDYKGLSNAGTWFIGKLQTERDKLRVLDGLEGAIAEAGSASKIDFGKIITSLSSRVFLMHNVHDDEPVVYNTRWAMSYLRGPMTRPQVKLLMDGKKVARLEDQGTSSTSLATSTKVPSKRAKKSDQNFSSVAPSVDPSVDQRFFAVWRSASEAGVGSDAGLNYEPAVLASARVRFFDKKRGIDVVQSTGVLADPPDEFGRTEWDSGNRMTDWKQSMALQPDHPSNLSVNYEAVPDFMNSAKELNKVSKDYADWLYQNERFLIHEHEELDLYQASAESDEAFRMRVQHAARDRRDEELDKMQEKYEPKLERVEDRIRRQEHQLSERIEDAKDRRNAQWVGVAETVFSMFAGRRKRSIGSTMTKRRMSRKANQKMEASKDELYDLRDDYSKLDQELEAKLEDIRFKWDTVVNGITEFEVKPRRTDIKIENVLLAWHPFWVEAGTKVSAKG